MSRGLYRRLAQSLAHSRAMSTSTVPGAARQPGSAGKFIGSQLTVARACYEVFILRAKRGERRVSAAASNASIPGASKPAIASP